MICEEDFECFFCQCVTFVGEEFETITDHINLRTEMICIMCAICSEVIRYDEV